MPKINLIEIGCESDDESRVVTKVASSGNHKSKSRSRAQWAPPKRDPDEDYLEPGFDPTASVASSFYLPSEPQSARSGRDSHRSGGRIGLDRSGKFGPKDRQMFDNVSSFQR